MLPENIESIRVLLDTFPTEESCLKYLEWRRWKGTVVSPFVLRGKAYKCKDGRYVCKTTRKYFTVRTDSVFEKTKIPLRDWFVAIWLMSSHRKGISSIGLALELGITQSTAWYLAGKVRRLLAEEAEREQLGGILELDEACFAGLQVNRHDDKKIPNSPGGHGEDKTWVMGIKQRNGELRAYILGKRDAELAREFVRREIKPDSVIISDSWTGYNGLDGEYHHFVVKDGKKIARNYNPEIHTNNIEGAWAPMKRAYNGIFNWWSKKHFQIYLTEFVFRHNTRKMKPFERFCIFLQNAFRRITYKDIRETAWNF